jgi:DNA-binding beta-propeller fold protein YncE
VGTLFLACSEDDIAEETPPPPPPIQIPKPSLKKQWETAPVFKVPESVLFNVEKNVFYVSNINGDPEGKDGNGFISTMGITGVVETLEWVKGLDAPKGMGIFDNHLYVADITNVKIIDITTASIIETIELPGAVFLNDLVIDKNGIVYISDTGANIIFQITENEGVPWINTGLDGPNGLHVVESNLYFVEFNSGKLYAANTDSKALELLASGFAEGDGIIQVDDKKWLISSFNGEVNFLSDKTKTLLLDTKSSETNAADIGYVKSEKLVLVPTFFKNTVAGYKFEN